MHLPGLCIQYIMIGVPGADTTSTASRFSQPQQVLLDLFPGLLFWVPSVRLSGALSYPLMFLPGGLCGGSASGKTTVANKIIEALDVPWVVLLSMDSFYKVNYRARSIR